MVVRPSYLNNGNPHTGKMTALYWDGALCLPWVQRVGPLSLARINYNHRISHHMPSKVRDGISYPFANFNDCTVEVWVWISNFIPLYNGCNYASLLKLMLNHISKRGPEYMPCAGRCITTLNIHHVGSCHNSTCLHYPHGKITGVCYAFLAQLVWCNCCTEPI